MAYTTDLNAELVSKQASKNTKMLFEYLKSIYGKNIWQVSSICKVKKSRILCTII